MESSQTGYINPRGMALVLCLLLISTLCLVGGAALSVSGMNQKIVHNGARQVQSFYLAEAGRELALSYLKEDSLWRGGGASISGFSGEVTIEGRTGFLNVSVSDCTADENGIYNEWIPAAHVLVESSGTWMDATQAVSCIARVCPVEGASAEFPSAAVISSGTAVGSIATLDELGNEDSLLLKTGATLPAGNENLLRAMADMAFSSLDDDVFDADLSGIGNFWRDAPADTRPYIFYVQGDLSITGDRRLYGIVFVAGEHVVLEDESGIEGVLYAPNATTVTLENTGASGRIVVIGQLITGAGGAESTGNSVSIQLSQDYIDAFNVAAGSEWTVDVLSGSWATL